MHHVKESAAHSLLWDLGFLASGGILVIAGAVLARRSARLQAVRDLLEAA
jgi:uncharacterized membrane protein